jgi:AraC-like DNA-binding protein
VLTTHLDLWIKTVIRDGQTRVRYILDSPPGRAGFSRQEIDGPTLRGQPHDYQVDLMAKIFKLGKGLDFDNSLLLREEVERKLTKIGRELHRELFPPAMRQAYREIRRQSVQSIRIVSDEPWIPWELIKPYDDSIPNDILDDDFLCLQFDFTRWLAHPAPTPLPEIRVRRLACIQTATDLPGADKEKAFFAEFARLQPGVQDVGSAPLSSSEAEAFLEAGGVDLLHFAGHGYFESSRPNESALPFPDGSKLRPTDLQGSLATQLGEDRPLVFLNACSAGQQGSSLTQIGGWADRWVRVCRCGAFIAPLWPVPDSLAFEFAKTFYNALASGQTFGQAGRVARTHVRRLAPANPCWLAYSIYADANGRLALGNTELSRLPMIQVQRGPEPPVDTLRRNSGRIRAGLQPYLLPRISRREVHEKYLPAVRESISLRRSRIIPILGSAGYGKSTLLGEIYDVLRSEDVAWVGLIDSAEISLSPASELPISLSRSLCDLEIPFEHLAAQLSNGGSGVLLIDTLDLLLSPAIVPHLQRLFFALEGSATTVVFTCRDVDYQLLLEPARLRLPQIAARVDRYYVPAFTPTEVLQAARAFLDTKPQLRETPAGEAFLEKLLSLSADSRSLQSITGNPLLLAMLCEVFGDAGDLPRDLTVSELYERHWDEKVTRSRTRGLGDPVLIEKPRICLRFARHLVEEWHHLARDWVAEPDLSLEGSEAVAQARAELVSDGILKHFASDRLRFFHQTFLEYVMARWLSTAAGTSSLQRILREVCTKGATTLHWWPVLRQFLALVEEETFTEIVGKLPLERLVAFRTVTFATLIRAEAGTLEELLRRALDLGPQFQKTLGAAAENAPARFLDSAWSMLESLLRYGTTDAAPSVVATVGRLLAREETAIAERLRSVLDALVARMQSTGEQEEDTEIAGQLLRACLPTLRATSDAVVFELLQERYHAFASKGKGLIINLFQVATIEEKQRATFLHFLFTVPRDKALPTDSLVALIEQVLRNESLRQEMTTDERLALLYRPLEPTWLSFHARAVARLFPNDSQLVSEVAQDLFSSEARSPHCDIRFLGEAIDLGQADEVCQAIAKVPQANVQAARMASLYALFRDLGRRADPESRRELARWVLPFAVDQPKAALGPFAAIADASNETWNEFVFLFRAAVGRGDDRLARKAVEAIPVSSLTRIAPEIERLIDRCPRKATFQHLVIAVYAPQVGKSDRAVARLVAMATGTTREVALAASLALARAVGEGSRLQVSELLPLAGSDVPGVRDHLMEAIGALQAAGCTITERNLVSLCRSLAEERNAPTLQKLCSVVSEWIRSQRRAPVPLAQWAADVAGRMEPGDCEVGAAGSLIRALKVMAQLEDPRLATLLQDAAQRLLRTIRRPNRLSFGEAEVTDLISALARSDADFLSRLVEDGPNLPPRNVRGLADAIRRVEGAHSPLITRILDSDWCPPQARGAILDFLGV